jgi:FtsP/CotA-like multicopper oxidase with cupredoxin domain
MSKSTDRRNFLVKSATAASVFATGSALCQAQDATKDKKSQSELDHAEHAKHGTHEPTSAGVDGEEYPRTQPGLGGPIGSSTDRGKLVPGLRDPSLPSVAIEAPDLKKLSWKVVDGVKEFHLVSQPVRREILPGLWMDTYGYNGDMPGPSIEINQGDRIRIVVHNELPEATTLHLHGLELPNDMDGIPFVTQDQIEPGQEFAYELTVHQEGTFFYHSHVGMQETMGMVGLFIVHPAKPHAPVVDRDFCLISQEFQIRPNTTVPDTLAMEWNYLTFNGRCGPLTTPLLCKLGERVRIRFINFSVIDHHPLHLHGHTFWITATEGGRMPESAWYPSNNVLVGVAQVREVEFIANNPGDWVMHCHMFHHMMNSMTSQAGPLIRKNSTPTQRKVLGFPQIMLGMEMPANDATKDMSGMDMKAHDMKNMPSAPPKKPHAGHNHSQPKSGDTQKEMAGHAGMEGMARVEGRPEALGMRPGWSMGVEGLMNVVRVLPPELYDKIMKQMGHQGHMMHSKE